MHTTPTAQEKLQLPEKKNYLENEKKTNKKYLNI